MSSKRFANSAACGLFSRLAWPSSAVYSCFCRAALCEGLLLVRTKRSTRACGVRGEVNTRGQTRVTNRNERSVTHTHTHTHTHTNSHTAHTHTHTHTHTQTRTQHTHTNSHTAHTHTQTRTQHTHTYTHNTLTQHTLTHNTNKRNQQWCAPTAQCPAWSAGAARSARL